MIKLNSLDNNGNPLIYYYNVSGASWDYGSFAAIVTNNAAPPSKKFPLDPDAVGGLYDHGFVFTEFVNGGLSTEVLIVGAGGTTFWPALDNFITSLTGSLLVDRIYIMLTEIEYTGFISANFKSYCQIGFDVYIS
jgi:hypothetical protein